jgi:hypothetical protein
VCVCTYVCKREREKERETHEENIKEAKIQLERNKIELVTGILHQIPLSSHNSISVGEGPGAKAEGHFLQ